MAWPQYVRLGADACACAVPRVEISRSKQAKWRVRRSKWGCFKRLLSLLGVDVSKSDVLQLGDSDQEPSQGFSLHA